MQQHEYEPRSNRQTERLVTMAITGLGLTLLAITGYLMHSVPALAAI